MNRQTTPAEVLDELVRWMSEQLPQCDSLPQDQGAPSLPRGVWHNSRKGATSDSATRRAPPVEQSSEMN